MVPADWSARPRPTRAQLEGQYVRLEPLEHEHAGSLYQAASADGAEDRWIDGEKVKPQSIHNGVLSR